MGKIYDAHEMLTNALAPAETGRHRAADALRDSPANRELPVTGHHEPSWREDNVV